VTARDLRQAGVAFVWPLTCGGEIQFMPVDGGFDVQHARRNYDSFGFIGHATLRPAAERLATAWLENAGLRRAP
jgi:hypothetical protein